MTEIAAFEPYPTCRKCGDESFDWKWRHDEAWAPVEDWEAPRLIVTDVLVLTCDRCGWAFNMRTKDEEGE